MKPRFFILLLPVAIGLLFSACQKPQGYQGEEVQEITEDPLLSCLSSFEGFDEAQLVMFNSESALRDPAYFTLDSGESPQRSNICWDNYTLQNFDFTANTLVLLTYTYADFGGPQDGDYVLEYYVHRKDDKSILRLRIEEEKGHDASDADMRVNTIWLSIPKVSDDHQLEYEQKTHSYRNV